MSELRRRWIVAVAAVAIICSSGSAAPAGEVTVRRVELVTVTDTTAELTWETDRPADTLVRFGLRRDRLDRAASGSGPTRFHHCELRGLRPGTEYHYVCRSGSAAGSTGPLSPGRFTTLTPPPGPERFQFATMTDTHVGQEVTARFATGGKVVSEGVRWRDPDVPFWQLTVAAAVKEINARRVAFTIIKGDVTDHGVARECPPAKRLLDGLEKPYHVVRGNHDGLAPLMRTFGLERPYYGFDHEGFRFMMLETEPFARGRSATLDEQLAWVKSDLAAHRGQRVFVFCHRPVPPKLHRGPSGGWSNRLYDLGKGVMKRGMGSRAAHALDMASGRKHQVNPANAGRLAALLREHGGCVGVFAGHLHRNHVVYWPERTGSLPYVETASTKEYPCGYAITRVFDGGYMHNYHVPRDPQVLEWSAMTREIYTKIGFGSKVGGLGDRNFVVRFDRLDLKPRSAAGSKSQAR